jgi:hypothetical protein
MASTLKPVFAQLKGMLVTRADRYVVSPDTANHYGLEGDIGPATLKAWKGRTARARIPIAWVTIEKAYVSFHLMAISDPRVRKGLSPALAAFEQAGFVVSRQSD